MNNDPIRIMLVDDHKVVRKSWKMLIENYPRFNVVADCNSGKEAIEQAVQLVPDIMLIDINMSPMNGFAVTEEIVKMIPSIKIIGMSVNNQPKYAHKMVELGAKGYLTKTSSLEEIHHGILEVYKGSIYICEEVKEKIPGEK